MVALAVAMLVVLPMPVFAKVAPTPKVMPPSTFILDVATDAVRTSERVDVVRPIASLTKLMTAMVLLDAHADLERMVAYDPKRHYAYKNWMRFTRGDRLRGRDLLFATLIGSQNIPPRMLVGLTPYSESEFVDAMNVKARELGLSHTRFIDVHGLSPENISTASEVVRLFIAALRYADIRDALARPSAEIAIISRRGVARTAFFRHTNSLLQRRQRFATEASKTGYLDEAGDAIAMLVRDPNNDRRYIIVALGEPRVNPRFKIAKRLAEQVIQTQRIAASN